MKQHKTRRAAKAYLDSRGYESSYTRGDGSEVFHMKGRPAHTIPMAVLTRAAKGEWHTRIYNDE